MQRALTGYSGPTIILVRPTEASLNQDDESPTPGLFGAYTSNPWNETKDYYGTSDCFLFRVEPTFSIYRPRSYVQDWNFEGETMPQPSFPPSRTKQNYMFFNPSAGHINNTGRNMYGTNQARGLAFGGTEKNPRLQITESLERCIASSGVMDATFESGSLLPGQWDKYFNVDVLEIWGVGGDDAVHRAINRKEERKSVSDANLRRVQRVDKRQFLEDFQSGMLLGSNGLFKHRYDGNVRHDFGTDSNADDQDRPCL